jgi:protein-disulfide isomerase
MHGGKSMNVEFLISADNTKLVHLDTLDLTQNPADAIPIAGRPIRGNANAKVTVVNFDDLECPYCARMHETIFPATLDHYKNLVKFVYKDVPLTEMHPWALHAAVDANCLAEQNSEIYWSFVDYVHAHGQEISGESRDPVKSFAALDRIAKQEGALGKLDEKRLDACISKQDATKVEAAATEARKQLNIDGTPVLFVNGERITGLVPQEQLWLVIDRALRAEGIQPPPSARPAAPAPAAANTVK